jgi:hypothetical protein
MSITTPDIVMLDKTVKEAHSIDAAIPNSHSLHCTITEKLQKYTDLKEELTSIWQLNAIYEVPLLLSARGVIPNKLHENLKQILAEYCIRSAWLVIRTLLKPPNRCNFTIIIIIIMTFGIVSGCARCC